MNERDEKLKWLKENLKTGIGCAKDPRHPHAFPAFSPEVTLKVTVSEKDNREKIKALSQNLGVRPAVKFEDLKQNEKNSAQRKGEHMKERTSKSDPHADSVGQKLKEFLDGVRSHPKATVSEIYRLRNFSASVGTKIKELAIKEGLVILHRINTGGGTSLIPELTPKAYEFLKVPPPSEPGKGKKLHRWMASKIGEWLETNYKDSKPELELVLDGKSVDVAIQDKASLKFICFEVQTSDQHILENCRIVFSENVKKIIFVCKDAQILKSVKAQIQAVLEFSPVKHKIEVVLLGQLISGKVPL